MNATNCRNCGAALTADIERCAGCGSIQNSRGDRSHRWQKAVAFTLLFILAITLGIYFGPRLLRPATAVAPVAVAAPSPIQDVSELKAKAERGEVLAQVALGSIFTEGLGAKRDYKEAAKWFRLAAEQGNAEAQNQLGMLYQAGQGEPQNDVEAVRFFRRAADQGHVGAEYNLASAYGGGRGVPQSSEESARWYLKAAEHGDAYAQFNVGQRYELGRGVAADLVEAYKWYELAARGAVEDARQRAGRLKGQLTGDQLREAQRRVRNFQANPAETSAKP